MKTFRISSLAVLLAVAAVISSATVANATVVDLTSGPGASGSINGALFFASDQQPAGTGFIQPFIRVQNKGFEQGYNTDGGFPFDDKHPHNFQHSVLMSSLSEFNIGGTEYFKFMLDANQSSHQFPLTQLQIFTSNDGSQMVNTFDKNGVLQLNGTLAYNLNAGGGSNSVLTTATGSGKFDMVMYVPVSDFNLNDKYMVFYFGGDGNGGFEEWTVATGVAPVPEASAFFPVIGLLAAVFSTRFVRRRQLLQVSK
jgi:hypothetical protein